MTNVHPERSALIDDDILTTDEVCALLKIRKQTLYKRTSNGTGPPFYRVGRHNRWKRREVLAWFDTLRREP